MNVLGEGGLPTKAVATVKAAEAAHLCESSGRILASTHPQSLHVPGTDVGLQCSMQYLVSQQHRADYKALAILPTDIYLQSGFTGA